MNDITEIIHNLKITDTGKVLDYTGKSISFQIKKAPIKKAATHKEIYPPM